MLLLDLHFARRAFDFHVAIEHSHGGARVFQFDAKVRWLGEAEIFPSKTETKLFLLCRL